MTLSEMVFLLRQHLSDEQAVGWPNESELVSFLDRAADYLSEKLIVDRDPSMKKRLAVVGSTQLPDDFVTFVGNVPVIVEGRACKGYNNAPVDVSYWGRLPYPSQMHSEDVLPFTREQSLLIVSIACVFAQNKNEFDVSQDMTLIGEVNKLMSVTRGGK